MCSAAPPVSATFVNTCIACGAVTIGQDRRFIEDGPPMGFCGECVRKMDEDPQAVAVYCLMCGKATFFLHIHGYTGDRIVFGRDCPLCNPQFQRFMTFTWKTWNENSSKNSSQPGTTPSASSSTDDVPRA